MKKFLLIGLLAPVIHSVAQPLTPEEGAVLNFTQVLFETPEVPEAVSYRFELTGDSDPEFANAIVRTDSSHVTIIDRLDFGKSYLWRTTALGSSQQEIATSPVHHFKIGKTLAVDSDTYRFRMIDHGEQDVQPGIIFLDKNGVAIDRSGQPVWYLPILEKRIREGRFRDLKMTKEGTLTFLTMLKCMEITIDGKKIWETPNNSGISGDTTDYFHHEFTKLDNGNYAVLAKSIETKSLTLDDLTIEKIPISVVVEFNPAGDTVWGWSTRKYILDDDLLKVGKKVFFGNTFGHGNSLAVSADGKRYYLGYRDLNAVLVVDRESRRLIASYGDKIPSDTTRNAIGFFRKQHAAIPLEDGSILLFNNNDRGATSSVVIFSESETPDSPSRILWEFPCNFDTLMPSAADRMGNAQALSNGNILVNMGDVARLFEVTREKEVIWDCLPEQWNGDSNRWEPITNYRLNFQSSLYPRYFSVSTRKSNAGKTYFYLTNEGSDADAYTVRFLDPKHSDRLLGETQLKLPPGSAVRVYPGQYLTARSLKKEILVEFRSTDNSRQSFTRLLKPER